MKTSKTTALLAAVAMAAVACSSDGETVIAGDARPAASALDSAAAIEAVGACDDRVDISRNVDGWTDQILEDAAQLDWLVIEGPHDVKARADQFEVFYELTTFTSKVVVADATQGLTSAAPPENAAEIEFTVDNSYGWFWPEDGNVLIGYNDRGLRRAFLLADDQVGILGHCNVGRSNSFNDAGAASTFGSGTALLEALIANPSDPAIQATVASAETPIETPRSTAWEDLPADQRTYLDGPLDALDRIQRAELVVRAPKAWQAQPTGGICSRTPVAIHECYAYTSIGELDDGTTGWIMRIYIEPGQPVTIFFIDEFGGSADYLVLQPDQLLTTDGLVAAIDLSTSTLEAANIIDRVVELETKVEFGKETGPAVSELGGEGP